MAIKRIIMALSFGIAIVGGLCPRIGLARTIKLISMETPIEQSVEVTSAIPQRFGRVSLDGADWAISGGTVKRSVGWASISKTYYQRDYRIDWMKASLSERIRLAEKIGIQGRARWAEEHGLIKLLGSQDRGIRQGPDSIYENERTGRITAIEAKGGSSPLKMSYKSQQGTNINTVRSAERTLLSDGTTMEEKENAARVIDAAERDKLETRVVRTPHILGSPGDPVGEQIDTQDVATEASNIKNQVLIKRPELADTFSKAANKNEAFFSRTSGPTEIQTFRIGDIPTERVDSGLSAGMDSLEAADEGLSLVSNGSNDLSLAIDRTATTGLVVAIAAEALTNVYFFYEYKSGRMTDREFKAQLVGSVIFYTCTMAGAGLGTYAGGVGVLPGTAIGATVGSTLQLFYDIYRSRQEIIMWWRRNDYSPLRLLDSVYVKSRFICIKIKNLIKRQFSSDIPQQQKEILHFLIAYYTSYGDK
jgi:hypothetical protein